MKNLILALVAAALLGAFGARSMLSQDDPVPVKLGFVDMGRTFEESKRRITIEDRLNKQTDQLEKSFGDRLDKLEDARGGLQLLNADSAEFQKQERELAVDAFLLDHDRKMAVQRLKTEARRSKGLLYREINLEIAAYGEQNGFAGIWLNVPVTDELDNRGDIDLVTSTRSVLWNSERLDITKQIIEILNK